MECHGTLPMLRRRSVELSGPIYMRSWQTQAGVQILSDVMRREFAPVGIDVITVELGRLTSVSEGHAVD